MMRVGSRVGTRSGVFGGPLGTRERLLASVEPAGPEQPSARLHAHTLPVFDTDQNQGWGAFIETMDDVASDWEDARDETLFTHYVELAQDRQLDYIGRKYLTPRKDGESDDVYRVRIILAHKTVTAGGTVDDFKEVSAVALDADPEQIVLDEPFDTETARVDITVEQSVLDSSNLTVNQYINSLQQIKAAGVKLNGFATAGFTHRSEEDFNNGVNDSSKGYNELDSNGDPKDLGGGYAQLFT